MQEHICVFDSNLRISDYFERTSECKLKYQNKLNKPDMAAHAYNPGTGKGVFFPSLLQFLY